VTLQINCQTLRIAGVPLDEVERTLAWVAAHQPSIQASVIEIVARGPTLVLIRVDPTGKRTTTRIAREPRLLR